MGFSLPQLSSSCCGCTLRTGSLIILWIYLVISILLLVVPPLAQPVPSSNSTIPAGSTTTTPSPVTKVAVAPLTVADVIIGVINIVVGSVGLYGVYKELNLYLLPWLVWEAVFTLQQIIRTIIADFTLGVILGELLVFLIMFYFWLVVYSHYRVLKGSARPIQA